MIETSNAVIKMPCWNNKFSTANEEFRELVNNLYCGAGTTLKTRKRIKEASQAFANTVTAMTGTNHSAMVQFSDEHGMVQVTIKSDYGIFCFVRVGGNGASHD